MYISLCPPHQPQIYTLEKEAAAKTEGREGERKEEKKDGGEKRRERN